MSIKPEAQQHFTIMNAGVIGQTGVIHTEADRMNKQELCIATE